MACLFSSYSCLVQSATKFSNCLYRACNCSRIIVYRRQPLSSTNPRSSSTIRIPGFKILLALYSSAVISTILVFPVTGCVVSTFISLLDCGGRLPGPGFNYSTTVMIWVTSIALPRVPGFPADRCALNVNTSPLRSKS